MFDFWLTQLLGYQTSHALGRTLYLYAGPGREEAWKSIRRSIPAGYPLLYLFPPDPGSNDTVLDPLALALPVRDDTMTRIILTANCLKVSGLKLAAAPDWPRPDWLAELQRQLPDTVHGIYQEKISRLFNLRCAIANLPRIAAQQECWPEVPPGTPALICGAGPSLRFQLEQIRRERTRFYLIAVGKLTPVLLQHGIAPDCIVYVDRSNNGVDWQPIFASAKPLLVTLASSSPSVAAAAQNIVFAAGPSLFARKALAELGLQTVPLYYASTATATALDFATRTGFSAIGLVGLDSCLDGEATHLPGYGGDELLKSHNAEIPGNDGPVVTTPELTGLRLAVEGYLAQRRANVPVCNCTRGVAVIAGTIRRTLDDFLSDCPVGRPAVTLRPAQPKTVAVWPWSKHWAEGAQEHADHLALEQPLVPGQPLTPPQQAVRGELGGEFAADLKTELEEVNRGLAPSEDVFPGFRRLAIRRIRPSDPDLADWLARHPKRHADRFDLHYNFMENACIALKTENGNRPLTGGSITLGEDAAAELDSFFETCRFDAAQNGLVLLAPLSWLHAVHAAAAQPGLELLVIEPWPELLGELVDHCLFLHRLPLTTAIVGTGPELSNWPAHVRAVLARWRQQSRQPVLFVPPSVARLPEIVSLRDTVKLLFRPSD